MPPEILTALIGAFVAFVVALIAVWQALSASKQAEHAEEQADAAMIQADSAEKQAKEAKRSADAAWAQIRGSHLDRLHTALYQFLAAADKHYDAVNNAVSGLDLDGAHVDPSLISVVLETNVSKHEATGKLLGGLPPDSKIYELVQQCVSLSDSCVKYSMIIPMQRLGQQHEELLEEHQERAGQAREDFMLTMHRLRSEGKTFFEQEYRRAHEGSGNPN